MQFVRVLIVRRSSLVVSELNHFELSCMIFWCSWICFLKIIEFKLGNIEPWSTLSKGTANGVDVNGFAGWGADKYTGSELDEMLDSQFLLGPADEVVQNQKSDNSDENQRQNSQCEQMNGDASCQ